MQNLKPTTKSKLAKFFKGKTRVNSNIKSKNPDNRIVVNKSNKYIKAQLLDINWNVLAFVCDKDSKLETKSQRANEAWQKMAKLIKEKNIGKVVFDRNWYLYHGRVKSFADWIREWWVSL